MKLLKRPESIGTHQQVMIGTNTAPLAWPDQITDVEIFIPVENNTKDKIWNKLKYGCTGFLRIGEKVDRIVFEKEGCILYGIIPVMEAWDVQESEMLGRTFTCKIDYYENL